MENFCLYAGATISLLAYYLLKNLVIKKPESYSAVTFLLWSLIELISSTSLFLENGYWQLPFVHFLGCGYIFFVIYINKPIDIYGQNKKFNNEDLAIIAIIILCIILWVTKGNMIATIASVTAALFASTFQMKESRYYPDKNSIIVWIIFLSGSLLTFFANNDLDEKSLIEEKLYSIFESFESLVLIILNLNLIRRKRY